MRGSHETEETARRSADTKRLVSEITSPLSSRDVLSNAARDEKMVGMLSNSLTVVSRLLSSHGDGATRLRHRARLLPAPRRCNSCYFHLLTKVTRYLCLCHF